MSENESKKLAKPAEVLRVYTRYAFAHPWLFGVIVVCGLILQAANLIAPLFMSQFFNTLSVTTPSQAAADVLLGLLGLIALMWAIDWAFRRLQDVCNIYLASSVMGKLYSDSFEYLLGHSYNFFVSNFAGTLTHRVNRYARSYETIYDTLFIQFYPAFLFIVGATGILFFRNVWLGLALLGWSILFAAFQIYVSRLQQPSRKARAEADTKITAVAADAISNQATVIQFSGTQFEREHFSEVVNVWRRATLVSWLQESAMWGGIGFLVILIQGGLFWGGIALWQRHLLTLGDFILIQSYLLGTFNSLMGISYQLRRFYDAFADAGEMVHTLQEPHEVKDMHDAPALQTSQGAIAFQNVDFRFQDGREILKDFSLFIEGGEKIALVGPSGAGKSTITKLLLRLYDISQGGIYIDGVDIAKVTQDSLRNAISFVPQEPILFHRTLMENIRYGRRDATDKEVIDAAKQAHCHEFISNLKEGYNTYVGERGIKLSGGERQRVAIARAILKNAPILVLDEATSSLDSESEALIQDALETLMKGKTVVVIAHRLSTIMKMDRIIVMEKGTVVAQGTHLELVRQRGLYHKLWSIQAGGFIGDGEKHPSDDAVADDEDRIHVDDGELVGESTEE